jgi:hypothetical protein
VVMEREMSKRLKVKPFLKTKPELLCNFELNFQVMFRILHFTGCLVRKGEGSTPVGAVLPRDSLPPASWEAAQLCMNAIHLGP